MEDDVLDPVQPIERSETGWSAGEREVTEASLGEGGGMRRICTGTIRRITGSVLCGLMERKIPREIPLYPI